jgi:transposase
MDYAIDQLPDEAEALKGIIQEIIHSAHKQSVEHEKQINILKEQIRLLTLRRFGRKSEKLTEEEELQGRLFNEAEDGCEGDEDKSKSKPRERVTHVAAHTRRTGTGKQKISDDLPRKDIIHDLKDEEKKCPCGYDLVKIGEEISEKVDCIPPQFFVNRHIRYKYACKKCEGVGSEGESPAVKTAPMPPQLIEKGIVEPGMVAWCVTAKFVDAIPFYRLSKIMARSQIEISRATLCNWGISAWGKCARLFDLMLEDILDYPIIGVDETRVQVLNEPDRKNTQLSYMWVFRGGGRKDKPIVLFIYESSRSANEVLNKYISGYDGYLQSDGYKSYNAVSRLNPWTHVGCWSHTRRKFFEASKCSQAIQTSYIILDHISKLYAVEEEARKADLSYDDIKNLRQEKSGPVIQKIKVILDREVDRITPAGLTGKAIRYSLSEWNKLVVYLENGCIPIDNNYVENAIRPFVMGRKNWLFSGSPTGAHASAGLYSLVETSRACGLEPYKYLKYVFERIPAARTDDEFRALLPYNCTPDKIK